MAKNNPKKDLDNKQMGYHLIWRSVQNHWLWDDDEPFDKRSAWIDLILSVNHEDAKLKIGSDIRTIHAGQMWTSYVKLAQKWHWSKMRVLRYIKLLKSDGMILVDGTPNGTLLTLVNYGKYRSYRNANGYANEYASETTPEVTPETTPETQTNNINNINNYKELKEKGLPPLDERGLPPLDYDPEGEGQ